MGNMGGDLGNEKSGVCPPVVKGQVGTCQHECDSDAECAGNKLCCRNGCGRVCMKPVKKGYKPPPAECSMMLTFQQKPNNVMVESLIGTIPKPDGKQFLGGVGILILRYGT